MGFRGSYQAEKKEEKKELHPVWRGIGCVIIILTPVIAYTGALVLFSLNQEKNWVAIPRDMLIKASDPYILIKIGLAVILAIILFALFLLVTFVFNSILGPSRYGPHDVPQQSYKGKGYKR
ncbi:MAG: hypothetical protein JW750_03795 [Anaerolineaceae bacterium]|nr:hypothetical protein [Anaerolineaceae bacterium]